MDFIKLKKGIHDVLGKYKYVCIVLLAGIILMMLPSKETHPEETMNVTHANEENDMSMEEKLENILSCVKDAGNVKVMLSVAKGESSVYQTDSNYSQSDNHTDSRTQTVLVTDKNRNETGLLHQKNPPVYQGAIVLVQGADDPKVKLAIVDAVMDVTGLGADRISVLKMR